MVGLTYLLKTQKKYIENNSWDYATLCMIFSIIWYWHLLMILSKLPFLDTIDGVIFDGAWSFGHEWKASTLDEFRFNDDDLVLRTAHQDDYMYVLIDVLGDMTNDRMADRAIVCLDGR